MYLGNRSFNDISFCLRLKYRIQIENITIHNTWAEDFLLFKVLKAQFLTTLGPIFLSLFLGANFSLFVLSKVVDVEW